MVDLAPILAVAEAQVNEVLATSGTVVTLQRPAEPAAAQVDPTTLAVTEPAPTVYATGVEAVVAERPGAGDGQPARPAGKSAGRVLIAPRSDVQLRDEVVVTGARDPALVGRVYAVTSIVRSGVGVVAQLNVDAVPGRP